MKKEQQDKKIGGILHRLMQTPGLATNKRGERPPAQPGLTSLGVPLLAEADGHYVIDVSEVKIFIGIAEFLRTLATEVLHHTRDTLRDVMVQCEVDPQATPELSKLGVDNVSLYARSRVARGIAQRQKPFLHLLRLVFDAIQTERWGAVLFPHAFGHDEPDTTTDRPALLFTMQRRNAANDTLQPDSGGPAGNRDSDTTHGELLLLAEYEPEGAFLRITVEDARASRLFLKRIPHRVVQDLARRHCLQDTYRIAEQIFQGIQRECQTQQDEYTELPGRQPALFELLMQCGLEAVVCIKFRWSLEDMEPLLLYMDPDIFELLSKILLLFEDTRVMAVLAAGDQLEMLCGKHRVFFDLSRGGACLNISLDQRRKSLSVQEYARRMPAMSRLLHDNAGALAGFRVLFIHHITAEILGTLRALEALQSDFVTTLFIKYKGQTPDEHLDALFTLDQERFRFHSLQRVEARDSLEGNYILSRQYSPLAGLEHVEAWLRSEKPDYLEAMRSIAFTLFFHEICEAKRLGRQLLLVEDGGYIAPLLNAYCLDSMSVGSVLALCGMDTSHPLLTVDVDPAQPLGAWLSDVFPGSVEHTRNGYDKLRILELERKRLYFPALSIAISELKNVEEARECAYSILNAVETIFHSMGLLLSRRNVLLIGCRGNIGGFLLRALSQRLEQGRVCGVDLDVNDSAHPHAAGFGPAACSEHRLIDEITAEIVNTFDLVIGVTGVSVLSPETLAHMLVHGPCRDIFLASGSTKTVEFAAVSRWLQELRECEAPHIGGEPVRLNMSPLKDPQTGVVQGHRVRVHFLHPDRAHANIPYKDVHLLGDLMPINFLYYGVPMEVIDDVLCQLLELTVGLAEARREGRALPHRLLAVDHEIDGRGNILSSTRD